MKMLRAGHPSFPAWKAQVSLIWLVLAEKRQFWVGRRKEQTERKGDSPGHSIHPTISGCKRRPGAAVRRLLPYPPLFAWPEPEGAKRLLDRCPPLPMLDSKSQMQNSCPNFKWLRGLNRSFRVE